jgi:SAM-dependent methyltransferase
MNYINDSESQSELVRLNYQAQLVTRATGLLPALLEDTDFTAVLDVGCGTGAWAVDLACDRRTTAEVVGIDISPNLISYAVTQTSPYHLHNLSYEVLDIFQKELPFAKGSFDLINLRFGVGWVKGYANWLLLLVRLFVLLKPGGHLVITEGEGIYTNSLALERLQEIFCTALHKTGYSLSPSPRFMGVVAQMGHLLRGAGFQSLGVEASVLDYSYYHHDENIEWRTSFDLLLRESKLFLLNSGVTSEEELAQVSLRLPIEMYQEDFCGMGPLFSFYARKP